jgi:16S rRNA (cytosine1402-N4)-methyltransferase
MNRRKSLTAARIINEYSVKRLMDIFLNYGELSNAAKIATEIERVRLKQTIQTTKQLQEAVLQCAPRGQENKFFAKMFQALRIEVNDEMEALKDLLAQSVDLLRSGGRIVIISYHSLEDRLVKNFFKSGNFEGNVEKDFYGIPKTSFRLITKKPVTPGEEEIQRNGRARSAKLRIAEKI